MSSVILLATIMAISGVVGYQRGTRPAVINLIAILGGLFLISHAGPAIARLVNGINRAVHVAPVAVHVLGGNGGGDISQVVSALQEAKPLVAADGSGPGFPIFLFALASISFLLGRTRWLRGIPSLAGLALGLVNGYLFGAYLLTALGLSEVMLPLPFGLSRPAAAGPAAQALPQGPGLFDRLISLVTQRLSQNQLALLMVIAIGLFVVLATRFSSKSAKKG